MFFVCGVVISVSKAVIVIGWFVLFSNEIAFWIRVWPAVTFPKSTCFGIVISGSLIFRVNFCLTSAYEFLYMISKYSSLGFIYLKEYLKQLLQCQFLLELYLNQ